MVSKNNIQERIRKMEDRKERHSIWKFSVGIVSILIGLSFMGMNGGTVSASTENSSSDDTTPDETKVAEVSERPVEKIVDDKTEEKNIAASNTDTENVSSEEINQLDKTNIITVDNKNNASNESEKETKSSQQPSYEDMKNEVDNINQEINKELDDFISSIEQIDGVTVNKENPDKIVINTTIGAINANKELLQQRTQAQGTTMMRMREMVMM